MNENLFPPHSSAFGKGSIDGAILDRVWSAIRVLVVNHVVQRPAHRFLQPIACELLCRLVHEDAVLMFVHQEDGHCGVAHDSVQSPLSGLHLTYPLFRLDSRDRVLRSRQLPGNKPPPVKNLLNQHRYYSTADACIHVTKSDVFARSPPI
nr:hypothetical protein [Sphingomonas xinjiangensis]